MQLIVVNDENRAEQTFLIEAMLRLRARIFGERLNWQVDRRDGLERDRFDEEGPTYIIGIGQEHQVVACVRLLPPMRSSMLNEVFPELLDHHPLKTNARMIESSRFCVDRQVAETGRLTQGAAAENAPRQVGPRGDGARSLVQMRTRLLLSAIVEWSLAHGYDELVTATDVRFERLLNMVGWPFRRLGAPRMINETNSVAGSLEISEEIFQTLKPEGYRSFLHPSLADQMPSSQPLLQQPRIGNAPVGDQLPVRQVVAGRALVDQTRARG